MRALILSTLALLAVQAGASTLVVDPIVQGPQTAEQFDKNFKAIKAWTDLIEVDNDDLPDVAERFSNDPINCPAGQFPAGISANGDVEGCVEVGGLGFEPGDPTDWTTIPTSVDEAIDILAAEKLGIADSATITTCFDPVSSTPCGGPQMCFCIEDGSPDVLHFNDGSGWTAAGGGGGGALTDGDYGDVKIQSGVWQIDVDTVTTTELAGDAVYGVNVADSSLTGDDLGNNAVTGPKTGPGAVDVLTDFSPTLCGTNEVLKDAGASWTCVPEATGGGALTTLAALEACAETVTPSRYCKLAPGTYNTTGVYIELPDVGDVPQVVVLDLQGVVIDPTGTVTTQNGHKAVFQIDIDNVAHDHMLEIVGGFINGSTDTNEELLVVTQTGTTPPHSNGAGKFRISGIQIGEGDTSGGTERAFYYDRANAGDGQQLYVDNSKFVASGVVFQHDQGPGNHYAQFSNVRFTGSGNQSRADNLCFSYGVDSQSGTVHGSGHGAIQFNGVTAELCGGFTIIAQGISGNLSLNGLGNQTENGDVFLLTSPSVQLDLALTSSVGSTAWSKGTMFKFTSGSEAVRVNITDAVCNAFNSTETMTLFEGAAATAPIGNMYATLQTTQGDNGINVCAVVPLGPVWSGGLGTPETSIYIEAFGEIWETATPESRLFRRAVGSLPFTWRGSVNVGTISIIPLATPIVGVEPSAPTNACFAVTGGVAGCQSRMAVHIPVNTARPLYLNSFACVLDDGDVINADEDDAIDVVLQKQTTFDDPTSWANVTNTPGEVGRIRMRDDSTGGGTGQMLTELGYFWNMASTGAAVKFAAGEVSTLRVLTHVEVDTATLIGTGQTLRLSCTVQGYN